MKAYLMVTGAIFGLIGIGHLFGFLRELFTEGPNHVLGNRSFLITSIAIVAVGVGVGVWALSLLRGTGRHPAV